MGSLHDTEPNVCMYLALRASLSSHAVRPSPASRLSRSLQREPQFYYFPFSRWLAGYGATVCAKLGQLGTGCIERRRIPITLRQGALAGM